MANLETMPNIDFTNSVFLESSRVNAYASRLNWRAEILIARNAEAFVNKRVLDLASHDGRFSYAALASGATHVLGVEARESHVERAYENLQKLNCNPKSYDFVVADLVDFLGTVQTGEFDTILCFGVMSHLIEHVEVFREVRRIAPSYFILDTAVAQEKKNLRERHRNYMINRYVGVRQLGEPSKTSRISNFFRWIRAMTSDQNYRTGTMIFLYENQEAEGATIRQSGLMAWGTASLVEILFEHFDFSYSPIDWRREGVSDWSCVHDYRNGERGLWIARPKAIDKPPQTPRTTPCQF